MLVDENVIKYRKKRLIALKDLQRAIKERLKQEPAMRELLIVREREMAGDDGLNLTEEEIKGNVEKQMDTNPYKVAFDNAMDVWESGRY